MRFNEVAVTTLAISLCFARCDVGRGKSELSKSASDKSNVVALTPEIVKLKQGGARVIDPIESKIRSEATFTAAQFVDSRNGWARTDKSLYRSTDGGATWKRLSLILPLDSHISSFFFIDNANGWLTFVNRADVERYGLGNSSHILASTDGGTSWTEQARFAEEVDLGCVRFLNRNEGLATGSKVLPERPPYDEIFAISTSDGGKTWNNISEKLKVAMKDEYGYAADYAHNIEWSSPSRLFLLTRRGKIISSADKGQTWKVMVQFKDERPDGSISSTGYYKLVLDSQARVRVVAGARGEEGYWGDLVVDGGPDRWISYELILVPILDAMFLSDNEVIACGQERQRYDERTGSRQPPVGIILHSLDSGKSWSALYRSKSNETFIYLTRVSDNQYYAIGDGGTFLRFVLRNP